MNYGYGCNASVADSAFRHGTKTMTTKFLDGQIIIAAADSEIGRSSAEAHRMMKMKQKARGEEWIKCLQDGSRMGSVCVVFTGSPA